MEYDSKLPANINGLRFDGGTKSAIGHDVYVSWKHCLGLAVDDTVHFLHNFRRYHQESGSVSSSVSETLHTTGRAMLFSTIALSIGFFAYTQSSLNNLISFGLITGFTIIIIIIIIALLVDLLLAPAMMALIYRNSDSPSK